MTKADYPQITAEQEFSAVAFAVRLESCLAAGELRREREWSEAIAVGRRSFVERVQEQLGKSGRYRKMDAIEGGWVLREAHEPHGPDSGAKMGVASPKSDSDSGSSRFITAACVGPTLTTDLTTDKFE